MADIITEITSNPLFLVAIGILAGSVFVFMWLSKRQKEAPEAKFGYGHKLWSDITSKHLKNILAFQGIKPYQKKKFVVGNEVYGNVNRYLFAYMLKTGEVSFNLKSYLQIAKEDRDTKLKKVDEEYARRIREFDAAKEGK
jgi:hypothetical protein